MILVFNTKFKKKNIQWHIVFCDLETIRLYIENNNKKKKKRFRFFDFILKVETQIDIRFLVYTASNIMSSF